MTSKLLTCGCGTALNYRNISGRCGPCSRAFYNSDPATIAKRRAGIRKTMADPEFLKRRAAISRSVSKLPHVKAAKREVGYRYGIANLSSPESRAKAVATRRRNATGWCPPERHAEYRRMLTTGFTAAEARRMIEEEIPGTVAHARRHIANQREVGMIREARRRSQEY